MNLLKSRRGVVISGLLLCGAVSLGAESPSLTTLEELVEQWVGLRTQISTEKQAWERQAEQWRRESDLLREEERLLDAQIERTSQFEAEEESRTSGLLARKQDLHKALAGVDAIVDRATTKLSQLLPFVPAALQSSDLKRASRELSLPSPSKSSARRLQLLVGVMSEVELLQNRNHVVRELIDPGAGERREMDVVYLGLARGYAVSHDNMSTAAGIPTESGWRWSTIDPSAGSAIRALVRILNEEQPPAIVTVPMAGGFPEALP